VYGFFLLLRPEDYGFLDNLDLAIHEAGHVFFGPFGEFIGYLGGTLMQLLVPTIFAGYFWRHGDRHAASVGVWWIAQNLWNISVYLRDARTQDLPLVGGGEHDWTYLLGELDLLSHDQAVGRVVYLVGVLLYLVAIGWGVKSAEAANSREPHPL
jgi:hypothetical protein